MARILKNNISKWKEIENVFLELQKKNALCEIYIKNLTNTMGMLLFYLSIIWFHSCISKNAYYFLGILCTLGNAFCETTEGGKNTETKKILNCLDRLKIFLDSID